MGFALWSVQITWYRALTSLLIAGIAGCSMPAVTQDLTSVQSEFPVTNATHTIYKSVEELRVATNIADQIDRNRREGHLSGIHRIATFDTHPPCAVKYPYRPLVESHKSDDLIAKGGTVFYSFDSRDPLGQSDTIRSIALRFEKSHNTALRLAVEVCPFETNEHSPYYRVVIAYLERDLKICDQDDCRRWAGKP